MRGENIMERTESFAIRILKMANSLPKVYSAQVIAHQVTRSATSVGANYRAACRSKSRKNFVNKLKIVEEELDETIYWLRLIDACNYFPANKTVPLTRECNELLEIIVKSIVTAKGNLRK
jgi:four helix bundle protein